MCDLKTNKLKHRKGIFILKIDSKVLIIFYAMSNKKKV